MTAEERDPKNKQRNSRRYEESKAAVVAAAISCINQKGVSRMTLADVAQKLGVATPALTYYFKKKDDLAVACLMQGLRRMDEFIDESEKFSDSKIRIETLFNAFMSFKRRANSGETEEFPNFSDTRGLDAETLNQAYLHMFGRLRGLLKGSGYETLKGKEISAIAHILMGEINWTPIWYVNIYPEDSHRYCERFMDILSNGLAVPQADWSPKELPPLLPRIDAADGASMELFLRAASAQINELGYRGTSIDKIAARINLTKGAFYHHIDTKDELVAACFKRTFDALHGTIIAAETSSASGLQTLSTFVSTLVNHQIRGEAPLLRTSAISTALDLTKVTILNEITKVTTRIASIICDGIADGSIRKIDANVGAQMVMAIINNADELPQYLPGISPTLALELYVHPIFRGIFQRAV